MGDEDASQSGANRRRDARVEVPLLVQYRFGALEELRTDYALNVSKSGIFILTDEERPIGTRVFVQLATRDGAHFLQGEGRVVRRADMGWAIELVGFDDAARTVLDDLVKSAIAAKETVNVGPATRRFGRSSE
jgi:hypothetical protein